MVVLERVSGESLEGQQAHPVLLCSSSCSSAANSNGGKGEWPGDGVAGEYEGPAGRQADTRQALDPQRHSLPPAPSSSGPPDPQAQKLLTQMSRLEEDLGQIEKQLLAWARAPLSRTTPLEDLEGRIQNHQVGEPGQLG